MTFEELKKHAAENGTQAGVLVSSLAAAMVERGEEDERLLNLVETAKEQGSQGGALLIELLDVMYDLGYDEDILDELWEGCSQQGNQSSAFVKEMAEIAEESPAPSSIWPPVLETTRTVKMSTRTSGSPVNGVSVYNVGEAEITKDFVYAFVNEIGSDAYSKGVFASTANFPYHHAQDGDTVVAGSISYAFKPDPSMDFPSGARIVCLKVNGNLAVLVHDKTALEVELNRFSLIDFNKENVTNCTVMATTDVQESVTYLSL